MLCSRRTHIGHPDDLMPALGPSWRHYPARTHGYLDHPAAGKPLLPRPRASTSVHRAMTLLAALTAQLAALILNVPRADLTSLQRVLYALSLNLLALGSLTLFFGGALPIDQADLFAPIAVWLLLAGAALSLLVLVRFRPARAGSAHAPTAAAMGSFVIGSLAAVYLLFTVVDHVWFFRGPHTGWTSPIAVGATDVPCEYALVRMEPTSNTVAYRCPTVLAFFQSSATPFVPWPAYTAGESASLKEALKDLMDKVTADQSK